MNAHPNPRHLSVHTPPSLQRPGAITATHVGCATRGDTGSWTTEALRTSKIDQRKTLRLKGVLDFIRGCDERYFVTLTASRTVDPYTMSKRVGDCLHIVNSKLFGNAYRRRRSMALATYAVQETNFRDGLHTHILVGVPDGGRTLKAIRHEGRFDDLIISTWCKLDHGARPVGQDVRPITDFEGITKYIHKDVFNLAAFDSVDVFNTSVPIR